MKMMKTTMMMILAVLLGITGIKAQSMQEGLGHLYADRDKSAKAVFEKMVAANPNDLDAIYWLGQTQISLSDIAAAKALYSRTLQSNGNAPMILVGLGHVDLIEGRKNDARQRFETAISISTGKKGVDANVLHAIGRAHVYTKEGDVAYALDKLKQASEKDAKNADIFLTLGDAFRKAHEGGQAVTSYSKAAQLNPTLARADYRIAKIYETQKNWDIYVENLNRAILKDPKFSPAYYELYYYSLGKMDFNAAQDYANKFIATTEQDPQNDYLRIQTLYAKKNYAEAIAGAKNLVATSGAQTKPRTFRLLAYSYVESGDTVNAKQYVDQFFAKATEDDITSKDLILKGQVYGTVSGDANVVFESYVKAAEMDSVYESKMKILQEGVDYFDSRGNKIKEAELRLIASATKRTPNPQDPLYTGITFYQGGDYRRADSLFMVYILSFPDSAYGHYYHGRANLGLDTTLSVEPYLSNMIQGFAKTLEVGIRNKDKYKSQAIASASFLAAIYNNTKKDKDSALFYLDKGLEFDPANPNLLNFKEQLTKTKAPSKSPATKPSGMKQGRKR